jgi:hypothetical protein
MSQPQPTANLGQPTSISSAEEALIVQTIDKVFNSDVDEALPIIEQLIQDADSALVTLQSVLHATWNYFQAIRLVRTEANFVDAFDLLRLAADGFDKAGYRKLSDLSTGMERYVAAVVEVQKMNVSRALELLVSVKEYLRAAGKFGSQFEPMIDHFEPETFFLAGAQAVQNLDFATAQPLIERASQATEKVARDYYQENSLPFNSLCGMSHFYRASYAYYQAWNDLNQFEYDKLSAEENLAQDAAEAQRLLEKGDTENVSFRNALHLSIAFVNLMEVIREFARIMQKVLGSTFKPDMQALIILKQKIGIASDEASEAGPQAVTLVRFCDQLSNQVKNLERLAKPNKKDFGAFSGLVASALFLPMFLVVSWANHALAIGLSASALITSCLVLALIGGFGFGALRFKSLIFPGPGREGK